MARQEKHPDWNSIRQGRQRQRILAKELHQKAGVPEGLCGLPEVTKFQQVIEDYQIIVLSAEHFNAIVFEGPKREKQIYLYLCNNHYDVITSVSSFLGRNHWCLDCKKGYDRKEDHRCNKACKCCFTVGCQGVNENAPWRECGQCHRMFAGDECYTNHCQPNKENQSVCQKFYKCKNCNKVMSHRVRRPDDHMCGEVMCWNCDKFVDPSNHRCYMKPIESDEEKQEKKKTDKHKKNRQKRQRLTEQMLDEEVEEEEGDEGDNDDYQEYLFFDIESRQDEDRHIANLLIVQDETGFETIFKGDNCVEEFTSWLLDGTHQGAIAIAHNLRGYDGFLLCEHFYKKLLLPKLILNGAKIMSMELEEAVIKFRDSLNFLPMPLKALPKTFGLTELKKGYFPHFFNRKENQTYVGPLPPVEDYDADSLSAKERKDFLAWYEELKSAQYLFNFEQEIEEYCRSDVDILRRCCLKFKQLMEETCHLDPFKYCVTIASACNRVFRQEFLEEDTIGLIPPQGYQPARRYSVMALKWLAWVHQQTGDRILHALNGGEQRIDGSYVDGYDSLKKTVYEFMGCMWHGCDKCYMPDTLNPINGTTMENLKEGTIRKIERLKNLGYKVVIQWECAFLQQLEINPDMKAFVQNLNFDTPLEPRHAFFGGRTNAVCLHKKVSDGEKIHYVDFTSLYPWTNKYCEIPIDHPEILTSEELIDRSPREFFGLIKCDILPPTSLFHPVLPYRAQGKLMFPLCKTCAENLQQSPCEHSDVDRVLSGTWCSIEVNKALDLGYRMVRMVEVWYFSKRSSELFRGYIDTFLKIKQEASGWPSWCATEQQKNQYIREYERKEGIELDRTKVKKNPGLRSLAKLMLNSFWGKFGQRDNMPQVELVKDAERYFRLLTCQSTQVKNIQFVNDDCIELYYTQGDGFVSTSDKTNVVIAAFTTAHARLKLYSVLELLQRRVLYFDTDSIIYTSKPDEWNPPLGDYLGELTNELDEDDYIITFVSGGPKNYSYQTKNGKTVCKVRGFTLNYRGSQNLNFAAMCSQICNPNGEPIYLENPHFIKRDAKTKTIHTVKLKKKYNLIYDKRIVHGFNTIPYGYH